MNRGGTATLLALFALFAAGCATDTTTSDAPSDATTSSTEAASSASDAPTSEPTEETVDTTVTESPTEAFDPDVLAGGVGEAVVVTGFDYDYLELPNRIAAGMRLTFTNIAEEEEHILQVYRLSDDSTQSVEDMQRWTDPSSATHWVRPPGSGQRAPGVMVLWPRDRRRWTRPVGTSSCAGSRRARTVRTSERSISRAGRKRSRVDRRTTSSA